MAFFDLFKKNDSSLPQELENLLNMVLSKGEITEKERAVLYAKAEKFDISAAELDIIIDFRLQQETPKKKEELVITEEEIDKKISDFKYSAEDSIDELINKYISIGNLLTLPINKNQEKKTHNALLVFINSITLPKTKDDVLELIVRTKPYCKTSVTSEAAKTFANVGMTMAKSASFVAKAATLGIASKVINKTEGLVNKAIMTDDMELSDAWKTKLLGLIKEAKSKEDTGLFSKTNDYIEKLNAFSKEIKNL